MSLPLVPDGRGLNSIVLLNNVHDKFYSEVRNPIPRMEPGFVHQTIVPSPSLVPIGVNRVFARIHTHNQASYGPGGSYEIVVVIFRASDFSVLGGVAFDINPARPVGEEKENERVYGTDGSSFFILHPGDAFICQTYAFGPVISGEAGRDRMVRWGTFAAASYYTLESPSGPFVRITSPTAGTHYPRNQQTVDIIVDASSPNGVAQVEFLVDGQVIGADPSAPYQVTWNIINATVGSHTLTARATDLLGRSSVSEPVVVIKD